jgi:signal peptidase I
MNDESENKLKKQGSIFRRLMATMGRVLAALTFGALTRNTTTLSDALCEDGTLFELSRTEKKETIGELIRSMAIAIFIALIIRSVAYEPFHIPSGSMLSTLYEGDYIFVSKLSYGYSRYSFPFSPDIFGGERILRTAPERGDVVVFRWPRNPKVDYIKRIIGLPGDVIQMHRGLLYINGKQIEITRREDVKLPDSNGEMHAVRRYDEALPNGKTHTILDMRDGNKNVNGFDSDNTPEYIVPEGHYFMMGDNRDNSEDSRYPDGGVGFVPEENFIGRAEVIALSLDTNKKSFGFRGDRWFKMIE